ncbi:EAL domain-containing protein [Bacillus sp. 31A1R]|uniref:EAL domain-containing protein n=1 Tax=Robertmurraya mangrovi TaxID=3098077 RepID=A0ABU5IWG9_9BACI|nr:EAL domain-containing protein [Bacillus sp. 31A1R]MDZ5471480.1 EAL domain-containing protein [Bacillus sp. 31A1R]
MFSLPESTNIVILNGDYSIMVVILSVIIACAAAYTALSMNERIQQNSFFHRTFWLVLASIAMGLGIWSMHFIGMSAFSLPVRMEYDVFLTIISVIPAVFASYLAFYISNRANQTLMPYGIAGLIMGFGIATMHYLGMAAMNMEAEYVYKPWMFLASILIAVFVSFVALFVLSNLQKYMGNHWVKIITSIIMGLGIASMHYTGMGAVVFYAEDVNVISSHHHGMDITLLIVSVTIGISIIFLFSGLSSLLDRYVNYRLNYYDSLTILPNRRQFEEKLRTPFPMGSLAVIHIHHLEKWNSGYGYTFGDQVIKTVRDVIVSLKPIKAEVYRIEGNRFAIFSTDKNDFEDMEIAMDRIMTILSKPQVINNHRILIEMVCAYSTAEKREDVPSLFPNVMSVLQYSGIRYKHEVISYDPLIHTYSFEKNLVEHLEQAMESNELYLVYQPKVSSETLEVTGVEALLRWNHHIHGFVSPAVFIPILEENGKMFDISDWVINQVCYQISQWVELGVQPFQVAINIPGPYITSPRLMEVLKSNVLNYGINNHDIELEITETSVINDIESAIKAIYEFRKNGFSVALDDFGTGLSSLSYLKRLPISTLKIDKSFVDEIPDSEKDSAIIKAIITLSHSLDLKIVIEGVESKEQAMFLSSLAEQPLIQGYYFSPALKPEELVEWAKDLSKYKVHS